MIADYYFIRKQQLQVNDLYEHKGLYTFSNGFNNKAIIALLLGILPNVPGFLTTIGAINKETMWPWVSDIYHYAWFVGFIVSALAYYVMMKKERVVINLNQQEELSYVAAN